MQNKPGTWGVTNYCQYLLVSHINYTLTNFADHAETMSHDSVNRYLNKDHVTGSDVWQNVKNDLVLSDNGYIVFDDTVIDKNFSHKIDIVRRQYSGNAHGIIKGIGVVNCVYVNPEIDKFWIIDFRIYDPHGNGKSKLDHVQDMLTNVVRHKCLPFAAVLMDSWYATRVYSPHGFCRYKRTLLKTPLLVQAQPAPGAGRLSNFIVKQNSLLA